MLQLLIAIVFHHECSQLAVQFTENRHIAITHLVKDRNDRTFAIGGIICCFQRADIRDIAVITYRIVVDIITHLLYQTIISHSDIPQRSIIDARMLEETFTHLHHLMEGTQSDVAIENDTMKVVRLKILCHQNTLPVLGPADIVL